MNPNDVADELTARLDTIAGLRCFGYPPGSVTPPAGIVSYPERIEFDETYGRGMDRIPSWPIVVVVGRATDRTARKRIYDYAAATGPKSVKAVLEGGTYTSFDTIRVVDCTFDVVPIAGIDYISALFTLDIAGDGS
jgi:hypothetical protein